MACRHLATTSPFTALLLWLLYLCSRQLYLFLPGVPHHSHSLSCRHHVLSLLLITSFVLHTRFNTHQRPQDEASSIPHSRHCSHRTGARARRLLCKLIFTSSTMVQADSLQGSCVSTAVSATRCLESNVECVCDSAMFLESVFECTTECGADEDGMFVQFNYHLWRPGLTSRQLPSTPPRATAALSTSALTTRPSRRVPMEPTVSPSVRP